MILYEMFEKLCRKYIEHVVKLSADTTVLILTNAFVSSSLWGDELLVVSILVLFFLMYSQTFLVTSVRGSVDLPQIAASLRW